MAKAAALPTLEGFNMEPYLLTIDDINALAESGMDMRFVGEGTPANQAEMEALGTPASTVAEGTMSVLNSPAPATFNSQADDIAATLTPEELASLKTPTGNAPQALPPVSASNVQEVLGAGSVPASNTFTPAPAQAPSSQAALQQALGLMAPQPASNDPYENLSKTQRRMLAFAGLSDAGAALQGRQGTSVKGMMSNFNAQADMQRKRQAAMANQQMLSSLMGGTGAPVGGVDATGATGVDALNAQKQKLLQFALASPASAAAIALQVKSIDDQIAKLQQGEQSLISTNMGIAAVDALINSPDLNKITGISGVGNEWLSSLGLAPEYSTLMSYVEQLRGLNFLEAFISLKGGGSITEMESKQATAARSRIDRALQGKPSDLIAALEDVRVLFATARAANLAYKGTGEQAPASVAGQTWNTETEKFE